VGTIRAMARPRTKAQQKDILSRVTDLGTEALQKLADVPGGSRLVEMANESRSRLDEVQKRLRGLDALEKRVEKLERQLAAQTKKPAASKTAAKRSTTAKRSTAKKKTT
jgi:hypothetical protein